jgi:hypothetical protein
MTARSDFIVLAGTLRLGETVRRFGYYDYAPAGAHQEAWTVDAGCELLFMVAGEPDFVPGRGETEAAGRVQLDSERMDWDATPIVPGPSPGLVRKLLRGDFETGERVALGSICPRWDYPKLEFHDCIEEIYSLSGDLWLGNCGTMRAGSYLWRPPYITHGPFYSHEGGMFIVKVDNKLINHFTDDPRSSPEQNRAQADREFAEGVFTYPGRT